MPIIQNGVKVDLKSDQKILAEIKKITGDKWPQVFLYIPKLLTPNHLNGGREDSPRSVVVPTLSVVTDSKSGQQEPLQYYTSSTFRDVGGVNREVYTPSHITFMRKITVKEGQKDLFWFLWNSKYNASGPSGKTSSTHFFYLQNTTKEATEFISTQGLELSAAVAIINESAGLPNDKIREVAAAYFIPNSSTTEPVELRKKLYELVFRVDRRLGKPNPETIKKFVKDVKSDEVLRLKSSIQKALDLNMISHNSQKKKWYYLDHEHNPTTVICDALTKMNAIDDLYSYLSRKGNEAEADEFVIQVDAEMARISEVVTPD